MAHPSHGRSSTPAAATFESKAAQRSRFGDWQARGLLGEGAMSQVYRAQPGNARTGAATYAVKVLRAEWENSPAAVDTVRREAIVGHEVSHPHVVSILDWSLDEPPYFVVMPELSGFTLQRQLSGGRSLNLPVAIWIARQIAEGLAALHSAGWMHADINPANVLISAEGHATLLDLGFARALSQPESVVNRPIVGTLAYLAPELFTSALAGDIRSDIYSLGVLFYQMLTGVLPFEGRGPAEVAAMKRAGIPDRLRCLSPHLPREVVELVRRMTAVDPLRRPQTPCELVDELVRLEVSTLAMRFSA